MKYVTDAILRGLGAYKSRKRATLTQSYKYRHLFCPDRPTIASGSTHKTELGHKVKSGIVYGLLGLLSAAALAQSAPESATPANAGTSDPAHATEVQQRRAALRATLKSQPEAASKPEAVAYSLRQLSAQERAQLRAQLRQQ